jgi:hypothetical protein
MRNSFVLGAGRSGTSALTGGFAESGLNVGAQSYPPDESNPKGYFEDERINEVNEELLAAAMPSSFEYAGLPQRPSNGQRWLLALEHEFTPSMDSFLQAEMEMLTEQKPFLYKDPRFSYTISAWEAVAPDAGKIVIFRDPRETAESIVRMCNSLPHLAPLNVTAEHALTVWQSTYEHILKYAEGKSDWLFLHRDQLLSPAYTENLQNWIGASFNREFVSQKLFRSSSNAEVTPEIATLYETLCDLAYSRPTSTPLL